VLQSIGQRISILRKKKGWKQKELGDQLGVSPQVISNWERDYSFPDHRFTVNLAVALDTTTDYILRGIQQENFDLNNVIDLNQLFLSPRDISIKGEILNESEKRSLINISEAFIQHIRTIRT
jgi:transcriptional regulator with XRE-family HTH domain